MKKLNIYLLIAFLGFGFKSFAQCTINTLSWTNEVCNGSCDGSATFQSLGTAPFNYSILPNIAPNNSNGIFQNLCAGVYTISSTDANSCTSTTTLVISQPPPIILTSSIQTIPSCLPGCDGTIQVAAIGGTSPLSYVITPNVGMQNLQGMFFGLCTGVYTVTAIDANGCTLNTISILPLPSQPTIDTVMVTQPSCGSCNGTAQITSFGGTAPYVYSVTSTPTNTPAVINGNVISGLCPMTNYTLSVTDVNGCSNFMNFSTQTSSNTLTGVTVSSNATNESCNLSGDGAIDLTVSPNTGLSYVWNNGDTTEDLVNVTSGIYQVTISNTSGDCLAYSDTVGIDGANCGTISGSVYFDQNNDCVMNGSDYGLQNIQIQLSNGALAITNSIGEYQFSNVPLGTYTLTQVPTAPFIQNGCLQPSSITLSSSNTLSMNNDFKDTASVQIDEYLYMIGTRYVPGFPPTWQGAWIKLETVNPSPFSVQNKVTLILNDSLNFSSSIPPPANITSTPNGDSLTWFVTVPPNSGYWNNIGNEVLVYVNTPTNLTMGSLLTSCAKVTPLNFTDVNMANNQACITKEVATSFDPNDKQVEPEGKGSQGLITLQDKKLNYRVRFQNTGTAPAMNIYIIDTLSNKLDINTLKIVSFSHPYDVEILDGHILKFKFNNIMLPDSGTNLQASNGYIAYSIEQKNSNVIGDEITNKAYIYFDFNAPIITNETVNTIGVPLGIASLTKKECSVYPNPAQGKIHISSSEIIEDFVITDIQSRVILKQENITTKELDVNTSMLRSGIYLLKIKDGAIQRLIIK